jgi:SAM-dependent methyltransferase
MLAADLAPGLKRRFPFELWPDFEQALWHNLVEEAQQRARRSLPFAIEGADRHGGALELARRGAQDAGVGALVRFTHAELLRFVPKVAPSIVVTNPPYGLRLADGEDLEQSWRDLGSFLHQRCRGATAWILCGNPAVTRLLGLRASQKLPVHNGPIDCRFLRYDVAPEAPAPAAPTSGGAPSPWIARHAHRVPAGGTVLDLACGGGRHTRFFLDRGHPVVAVDRDPSQLGDLAGAPGLEVVAADLEEGPWPLGDRRFDAIVASNYLWRPLLPRLLAALAPGGVLLYDTFAQGQERFGKPTNPDFLLRPNELLAAFGADLTVLAYEHGETDEPQPAFKQRLCARREP